MADEAADREQQAWRDFWELIGESAYQLWRDEHTGTDLQESA